VKMIPQAKFKAILKEKVKVEGKDEAWWDYLVAQVQPRTKFLNDIEPSLAYLVSEDYPMDEKAVEKRLKKPGVKEILLDLVTRFGAVADWSAPVLEELVKGFSQGNGMGPWVHPIRVAVSGRGEGMGLFEILQLLGREKTLARLQKAADAL